MKKFLLGFMVLLATMSMTVSAKSYKFEFKHSYNVEQIMNNRNNDPVVRAWAIAGNADKAIDQCKQDAVAAAIFTGISASTDTKYGVSGIPALASSQNVYEQHKAFFDTFFKKGQFMEFVNEVNNDYPTGENNLSVKGGRKVTILLVVKYQALRSFLQDQGIIPRLTDHFGGNN